jgi:hypothetical protein
VRLAGCFLTSFLLLCFLRELGVSFWPAVLTGAVAMWAPYRNEIWLGLGLSEAIGAPFALLGLLCALWARRSRHPWCWDLSGWLALALAIGVKNTFAAVVPAAVFLRLAGTDPAWREGWRLHGRHALLLASALLLPVIHLVAYKLDPSPKVYGLSSFHIIDVLARFRSVCQGIGIDWIGLGIVTALVAVWCGRAQALSPGNDAAVLPFRLSNLLVAGGLLLVCGMGIYLPVNGLSGRYTIPAVWGLDLMLAGLWSVLALTPAGMWKRGSQVALAVGVAGILVANWGRQDKFAARARLFWETLEYVEGEAQTGSDLAWYGVRINKPPVLGTGEGLHFGWHLAWRGRGDLKVQLLDQNTKQRHCQADYAVTGEPIPPGGGWDLVREFRAPFWMNWKSHQCYLWKSSST